MSRPRYRDTIKVPRTKEAPDMATSTLDISEARREFTKLDKRLRDENVIWITRRNKKVFAVVDTEMLQTIIETIDILSDPEAFNMLQQSLQDIRAGRLLDHEDVKRELCNGMPGENPMDTNSKRGTRKTSAKSQMRDN